MSSDAGNLNKPRRSHEVLPLSEKMKAIYLIRKEKNHMQLLGFPVRTKKTLAILSTEIAKRAL